MNLSQAHDEYFKRGFTHHVKGEFEDAAECYIRSIETHPTAEAHNYLGKVLFQLGEIEAAIEESKIATGLDPKMSDAWNDLGAYYLEKRKIAEAEKCFLKSIKIKDGLTKETSHYNLARLYMQKGMMLRATDELSIAIKTNPSFTAASDLFTKLQNSIH